jgi:hypothetical protein
VKKLRIFQKNVKAYNSGITLIALVITIIVMLILAGVSLNATIGDNGVITRAVWASFLSEMTALREQIDMKKAATIMLDEKYTDLFDEKVDVDDLPKSLKKEILYIIYGMQDDETPSKYDASWINAMTDADGYLNGFHYIDSETANGKEKAYIYDEERDIIYKVSGTNLLGKTVHSYLYGCEVMGMSYNKPSSPEYAIEDTSEMITINGVAYYSPNLENFRAEKTSVVYYQKNNTANTQEFSCVLGGSREIKIDGKNYVWYDYSEGSKIWANIKCDNNGVESYWVWIPRYAYTTITNDDESTSVLIKYVNLQNQYYDSESGEYKTLDSNYTVAEAFTGDKKGIWMSKYEPSLYNLDYTASTNPNAVNAPDLSNFNTNNTYYVTYSSTGEETLTSITNSQPEGWYDYTNKQWANIKTVANGIEAYWVWIPRYAYRVVDGQVEIIYVDTNNKALDTKYDGLFTIGTSDDEDCDFKVLGSFSQNGKELKGIWMSKYEPSALSLDYNYSTDNSAVNEPDLSNFNKDYTYYVTYSSTGEETLTSIKKSQPAGWYDYTNKQWANIKTIANGVEAYWVWIPRYAYRVVDGQVEIIFVDENNNPLDSQYNNCTITTEDTTNTNAFRVAEAFIENGNRKGIWMSKYEPSAVSIDYKLSTENSVMEPDLSKFNKDYTYYVTYSSTGKEILTSINDSQPASWYDYTNKQWANIKTVANGIEAYWVWIPRYAYRVSDGQVEIIYIDTNNKPLDSQYNKYTITTSDTTDTNAFKVAEAFTKEGSKKGIWVSKYEPSQYEIQDETTTTETTTEATNETDNN